jgi:hypothetical protein
VYKYVHERSDSNRLRIVKGSQFYIVARLGHAKLRRFVIVVLFESQNEIAFCISDCGSWTLVGGARGATPPYCFFVASSRFAHGVCEAIDVQQLSASLRTDERGWNKTKRSSLAVPRPTRENKLSGKLYTNYITKNDNIASCLYNFNTNFTIDLRSFSGFFKCNVRRFVIVTLFQAHY